MSHYEDEDYEEEPYEVQFENENKKRSFVSKDGKATAVFPNQDHYSGDYKNGKRNGKGTYKWERKNASYVGDYADGLRDGMGVMTYPDGSVYHGQWKRNLRHGHGVYTYANGDKFCGSWENNIRSGPGTYIYYASRTQLTGQWVAGECLDGKMWYCDENLMQAHKPFTALVRNNKISKYVEQVESKARVLFSDEEGKAPTGDTEERKSAQ